MNEPTMGPLDDSFFLDDEKAVEKAIKSGDFSTLSARCMGDAAKTLEILLDLGTTLENDSDTAAVGELKRVVKEQQKCVSSLIGTYASIYKRFEFQGLDKEEARREFAAATTEFRQVLDAYPDKIKAALSAKFNEAPSTLKSSTFNFQTSQESHHLIRAACDGQRLGGYRKDAQRGALIYEPIGASHRVELTQEPPSTGGKILEMDALEWLATRQNADFSFAFFYVCRLLAPPAPLPPNLAAIGWIDLDDVATHIGYNLNRCTHAEREELRSRVWQYLNYGARAVVIGERKTYRDRVTKKEIETRVDSPPWRILDVEKPVQTALSGEAPRRVQLLISKQWEPLLSDANLSQYLPFAEVIGAIPANQTAGAWARVLGMALANFWRRLPREATGGALTIQPTRRELLTHYTPKNNPPLDLLASDKPKRAVQYWRDALAILAERNFIAKEGEAARSVAQMLEPFGRKGWQESWLDEGVDLQPGAAMQEAVQGRARALPAKTPRHLNAPQRKGGRPKKPPQ